MYTYYMEVYDGDIVTIGITTEPFHLAKRMKTDSRLFNLSKEEYTLLLVSGNLRNIKVILDDLITKIENTKLEDVRPVKATPSTLYWSDSKRSYVKIHDMDTRHIRNALLKLLGESGLSAVYDQNDVQILFYLEGNLLDKIMHGSTTRGLYEVYRYRVIYGEEEE